MSAEDLFFPIGVPVICLVVVVAVGLYDIAKAIREREK